MVMGLIPARRRSKGYLKLARHGLPDIRSLLTVEPPYHPPAAPFFRFAAPAVTIAAVCRLAAGLFNSAGNNVLAKPAAPVSGSLMCAAVEWIERKE